MNGEQLRGLDIVCVGFADWEAELWTNQHHLMSRLAEYNRVLFVESLGLRRPQLVRQDLRRIVRRLDHTLAGLRPVENLHVISPPVLPFHGNFAVRRVNARLLRWAVARAMERLGIREPLLWAYAPQADALVAEIEPAAVVYHCVDDVAAHKGVDAESFRQAEDRFAGRADLVVASSPPLARRMRRLSPHVLEAPNVADVDFFASSLDDGPVDAALASLPAPRVVFTGAVVATKLDFDLILGLARQRRDWSIALVGPIGAGDPRTDVSRLDAEPNVYLLGRRHYLELPAVLRGTQVGIIPYAINELTRSVFPMKVYEYLAAGVPTVSTPLPSLDGVEGIVFASDASSMARAIDRLLSEGEDARRRRCELARGHSWEIRLKEIAGALSSLDGSRR
jgi:glycosyltransferase involved in cell wall biosynthesis